MSAFFAPQFFIGLAFLLTNVVGTAGPCSSLAQLKRNEGYNRCRHNVNGIPHVCYGFNLNKNGASSQLSSVGSSLSAVNGGSCLSDSQCDSLLSTDINTATSCASRYVRNYGSLSNCRKSALIDMAYNLGCGGLNSFTMLKAAVEAENWSEASNQILNSNYCTQVGCRCSANRLCMDPCGFQFPSSCNSRKPDISSCPSCGGGTNNPPPVVCTWTSWSTNCGTQTRTASSSTCTGSRTRAGPACSTPCSLSGWTNSGSCTGCGASAKQRQTRRVLSGTCSESLSQEVACASPPACVPNVACVWNTWADWTACSAGCGQGMQSRSRTIQTQKSGTGAPCLGAATESRKCTIKPCDAGCTKQDCVLSPWNDWEACSLACNGKRSRSRTVQTQVLCGGKPCGPLLEEEACNVQQSCDGNANPCPNGGTPPDCLPAERCPPNNCDSSCDNARPECKAVIGNGGNGNTGEDEPKRVVVGPGGGASSEGGLSTGAIAAIVAGSVICYLIIVAILIAGACLVLSGGSAAAGASTYEPAQENVAVGNPLFDPAENKSYSPIFQPGGTYPSQGGTGPVGSYPSQPGGAYPSAGSYPSEMTGSYPSQAGSVASSYPSQGTTCPQCGQSYPSPQDLAHHIQKRHGAGAVGDYPSAAAYPSAAGTVNYPSAGM